MIFLNYLILNFWEVHKNESRKSRQVQTGKVQQKTCHKEKKHEEKRYDLIVIFKEEKYSDIRNNESLNQLANWSYYSKKGFRGFCLQTKEELEGTIIQELALEKDDFEVINGDPELYVPS